MSVHLEFILAFKLIAHTEEEYIRKRMCPTMNAKNKSRRKYLQIGMCQSSDNVWKQETCQLYSILNPVISSPYPTTSDLHFILSLLLVYDKKIRK